VLELQQLGLPALAHFWQETASHKLKELNAEKRRQRPAPDTSDAHVTEYLYSRNHGFEDYDGSSVRFRIAKKTAKRIYYIRHAEYLDEHGEPRRDIKGNDYGIGRLDRQELEAEGSVWDDGRYSRRRLFASLEGMLSYYHQHDDPVPTQSDIAKLKAEMAAAHPDRSGTSAAFIAARARYVEARRAVRRERAGA
jgi:hypothetical protein